MHICLINSDRDRGIRSRLFLPVFYCRLMKRRIATPTKKKNEVRLARPKQVVAEGMGALPLPQEPGGTVRITLHT